MRIVVLVKNVASRSCVFREPVKLTALFAAKNEVDCYAYHTFLEPYPAE